jgi:hypothetical protein
MRSLLDLNRLSRIQAVFSADDDVRARRPFDRREGRADDDIARRLARYSLQRLDLS